MQIICFNHKFIRKDELSFYDVERFRVADACFESMLYINGQIPLLAEHQNRLDLACKIFQFNSYDIPIAKILELLNRNGLADKMARVRLSIIRKSGNNYKPEGSETQLLLECSPLNEIFKPIQQLAVYSDLLKQHNPIASIKHSNALLYVLATQFAAANNFDDVLLKNTQGLYIEASSSNLFFIVDHEIYTPKNESGCVLGVCRSFLLNFLNVRLVNVGDDLISSADEIFLSNGIQLIQSVKKYGGKKLNSTHTDAIIQQIKAKLVL